MPAFPARIEESPPARVADSVVTDCSKLRNADLNDRQLRRRSRTLGMHSRGIRRRFLATLPELERRGLIARRYGSIFEYAAKVGGARRDEVQGALRLARRLAAFPKVWALFETGRVGRAVLMRVPVEILAADEDRWVGHFEALSKREIEALVASERERRRQAVLAERRTAAGDREVETGPDASIRTMSGSESRICAASGFPGHSILPGQGPLPGGATESAADSSSGFDAGTARSASDPATRAHAAAESGPAGHGQVDAWPAPRRPRSPKHRILVELTEEEFARLLVARRERFEQTGRSMSMAEALKAGFIENYLDTRPAGEIDVEGPERARLERRAKDAAKEATGARIPLPVKRFVRVWSRGHCERPGCRQSGEHYHHQIKARARRARLPPRLRALPRHHPEALAHLCKTCHGLVHEGLVLDPYAPPGDWVLRAADSPPQRDAGDRAFGRVRAEVRSAGGTEAA